ncbi:hypothetical protein ES707_22441 [subsurface metagenome]
MPVMDIGLMRVLVGEPGMRMHMGVLTGRGEQRVAGRVGVVVVEVAVAVAMLVDDRLVPVGVRVLLGDQQPRPERHDRQRDVERACRKFGKEPEREEDAEERGDGEERTRTGGADAPEGEEEEDARQASVTEKPDHHGGSGRGRVREVLPGGEREEERDDASADPFY